jgi:hypothetical protein
VKQVTEPGEIDLEAIAWIRGVRVKFQPLDGCEARIVGVGDSAILLQRGDNARSFNKNLVVPSSRSTVMLN